MKILVTGVAGFIGSFLVHALLKRGDEVVGLDSINDYYDVSLKYSRLAHAGIQQQKIIYNQSIQSSLFATYHFIWLHTEDKENLFKLFEREKFDYVCHLAAQAGVRYSLSNPDAYIQSNIVGFVNILEACRCYGIGHLVYASSSSVYGLNQTMPFSTSHGTNHPISLYAASKKSNELFAHTYSHLFSLPTTGLRFFTVYGPWGRPDMALFLFTQAILEDRPIEIFNQGEMLRDFTYIDDAINGVLLALDRIPSHQAQWDAKNPNPQNSSAPYQIYNIGSNHPISLLDFIGIIEQALQKRAKKHFMPLQAGDVCATYADVSDLVGYCPSVSIVDGVRNFVTWYREFFGFV